ncbi:hypothetical protein JCM15519_32790 [Fundidesulfovibrio butyratiphilus]
MRASVFLVALLNLTATAVWAQTIGPVDPGAPVVVGTPKWVTVNGVTGVRVNSTPGVSQGYLVPDDRGGYIYYGPGDPVAKPKPARVDAEEIRLYARELAAQITGGLSGENPLFGVVSVPTAFVDQDTRATSSFGRLMGEQMIYELTSRGFPVKEVRGAPAKSRKRGRAAPSENLAILAGSYYHDKNNLFVNARLVEPSGRVIRAASVLIPMTGPLRAMLGIPDYGGLSPTPPTIVTARDINDPPGYGAGGAFVPYTPKAKTTTRSVHRKKRSAKSKTTVNCPPGCEPLDTAKAPVKAPAQASVKTPAPAPAAPATTATEKPAK